MIPVGGELPLLARLATLAALAGVVGRLALLARRHQRPVTALLGESFRPLSPTLFLLSLAAGATAVSVPWLAGVAAGWLETSWAPPPLRALPAILLTLALKALLVLCEELVFRGCLLPLLRRPLRPAGAILGSALVFALVHPWRDGFTTTLLLLDGLGFGLAFHCTRSLWAPAAWHLAKNCTLWLLYGRTSLQLTSGLFSTRSAGPALWVGAPGQAGLADLLAALTVVLVTGALLARQAATAQGQFPDNHAGAPK